MAWMKIVNDKLVVRWLLSKVEIPLRDIRDIWLSEHYSGGGQPSIRLGLPYATTDRVTIRTDSRNYIVYTTDGTEMAEQLRGLITGNPSPV